LHKDSIRITETKRRSIQKKIEIRGDDSDLNIMRKESDEELMIRPRNLKQFMIQENVLKRLNSEDEFIITKPNYEKISFDVIIPRYFRKDRKILEVMKSGVFNLFFKERVRITILNRMMLQITL
jgi:hypothetical protein